MSATPPGPLVCLGEALVDLICPVPLAEAALASDFEVHFGGALANVAVAARRAGSEVALAGGAGTDAWGRFLRARLEREGIDLRFQAELDGVPTAFAFATLDPDREPSFEIHGGGIDAAIASLAGREAELAAHAGAICLGSNTAVAPGSLAVTRATCDAAREAGVPLLFDPNLRHGRWDDLGLARRRCLELAAASRLLRCNLGEGRWLCGREDATAAGAAEELLALGPELVVVTAGAAPLASRGLCCAEITPPAVEIVSPLGSGDIFMGTLAAGLMRTSWDPGGVPALLEQAAEAAAAACERIGAFER